jgi:hypothetical protein
MAEIGALQATIETLRSEVDALRSEIESRGPERSRVLTNFRGPPRDA